MRARPLCPGCRGKSNTSVRSSDVSPFVDAPPPFQRCRRLPVWCRRRRDSPTSGIQPYVFCKELHENLSWPVLTRIFILQCICFKSSKRLHFLFTEEPTHFRPSTDATGAFAYLLRQTFNPMDSCKNCMNLNQIYLSVVSIWRDFFLGIFSFLGGCWHILIQNLLYRTRATISRSWLEDAL
jgi:hypothetical protein